MQLCTATVQDWPRLLEESARTRGLEGSSKLLRLRSRYAMRQTEFEVVFVKLQRVRSLAQLSGYHSSAYNLNATLTSAVTGRHFRVHLFAGGCQRYITILLVHVVCARTRIIANPKGEVLNVVGILLEYLANSDDFAIGAFHFFQLREEIPET